MQSNLWLLRPPPHARRRLRLFCFCYAGGNSGFFLDWQSRFDPAIEICAVQLPGRGRRFGERPYTNLPMLIADIANVIQKERDLPFAFFGHSLGGIIAFELARHMNTFNMKLPEHLFVSGCDAPQHRQPSKQMHRLADADLVEKLREYNGTPQDIFENPELLSLVLPTIRADFQLVENFEYKPGRLLKVPVNVLAGTADDHIVSDHVQSWRKETVGKFDVKWFEGDHFFINTQQKQVTQYLNATLGQWHQQH